MDEGAIVSCAYLVCPVGDRFVTYAQATDGAGADSARTMTQNAHGVITCQYILVRSLTDQASGWTPWTAP